MYAWKLGATETSKEVYGLEEIFGFTRQFAGELFLPRPVHCSVYFIPICSVFVGMDKFHDYAQVLYP